MFKIFELLKIMMFSKIVDDSGAGSSNDETSIYGDLVIDEDTEDSKVAEVKVEDESKNGVKADTKSVNYEERIKELEEELKKSNSYIEEQKNIQAVNEAILNIKSKMADFDEKAVYEHLKELNKTDPAKAQMYNNPIGWENIWNEIKPKDTKNDNVSYGRNTQNVNRDDEVLELVKSGNASMKDEVDLIGKFL